MTHTLGSTLILKFCHYDRLIMYKFVFLLCNLSYFMWTKSTVRLTVLVSDMIFIIRNTYILMIISIFVCLILVNAKFSDENLDVCPWVYQA